MRRDRFPFPILLNERIRENDICGDRAAQKASCLRGAPDHNRRVTVTVYLHVRKFYGFELKITRF